MATCCAPPNRCMALGRRLAWTLVLALGGAPVMAQAPLRAVVSTARAEPFALWHQGEVAGGLDREVLTAVALALNRPLQIKALPHLRVRAGGSQTEFDLVCGLDAERLPEADQFHWSPTLLEGPDWLVGLGTRTQVDRLDQLPPGATVGTVLGQLYPALEPAFADGRLKRDDALDEGRMVRKLLLQRHEWAVSNGWTLQRGVDQGGLDGLGEWRLPLGRWRYQCAIPKASRVKPDEVWAVLRLVVSQDTWREWVQPWTYASWAVVVSLKSPIRAMTKSDLVDLYMGRRSRLPDGSQPQLATPGGADLEGFLSRVIGTRPAQYRASWAALDFGGRRRSPVAIRDPESMRQWLQRAPEGIGVLPVTAVDASIRIVHLR